MSLVSTKENTAETSKREAEAFAFRPEQREAIEKVASERTIRKIEQFIDGIPKTQFFNPEMPPKKSWRAFKRKTWEQAHSAAAVCYCREAGEYDLLWAGVRLTLIDLVKESVGGSLVPAWQDAFSTIEKAIKDTAYFPVVDAARDTAKFQKLETQMEVVGRALIDATIVAQAMLTEGLELERGERFVREELLKKSSKRWGVWQRGFARYLESGELLYVYFAAKKKTPFSESLDQHVKDAQR